MKETIEEERLRLAYNFAMESYHGRQFAYEILSATGVFTAAPNDVNLMLIHEGSRRFGLGLMAELESRHPEKYFLMLKEGKQRNKEKDNGEGRDSNNGSSSGFEDGGSANLPSYDTSSIPI